MQPEVLEVLQGAHMGSTNIVARLEDLIDANGVNGVNSATGGQAFGGWGNPLPCLRHCVNTAVLRAVSGTSSGTSSGASSEASAAASAGVMAELQLAAGSIVAVLKMHSPMHSPIDSPIDSPMHSPMNSPMNSPIDLPGLVVGWKLGQSTLLNWNQWLVRGLKKAKEWTAADGDNYRANQALLALQAVASMWRRDREGPPPAELSLTWTCSICGERNSLQLQPTPCSECGTSAAAGTATAEEQQRRQERKKDSFLTKKLLEEMRRWCCEYL
jgi:hypothetical protein